MKVFDKTTQTYKEVRIKPGGDTLPIGTIVKYDGDTVPEGYEEVEETEWIVDTEEAYLTSSNPTVTIPHKFDDISDFAFRILGTDKATFGYSTIPKKLWHSSGTYKVIIQALQEVDGARIGYATLVVQNKTDNSFEIHVVTGSFTNIVVAYKLK